MLAKNINNLFKIQNNKGNNILNIIYIIFYSKII